MRFTFAHMREATAAGLALSLFAYGGFIIVEPAVGNAQSQAQSNVTQQITSELAFITTPSNVTLSPSIPGLTGGVSNGATQFRVRSNNAAGFTMTLVASSSAGMLGNSQGGTIPALTPAATGVPDFSFDSGTVGVNLARFAYTVEASTTADLDQSFRDNGTACNAGAADAADKCWLNASTTAETVINRNSATTASGATSTLKFRVVVQANPAPSLPQDTYTATTTLTVTNN